MNHFKAMKKLSLLAILFMIVATACHSGRNGELDLPKDFNSRTDAEKVKYLMEAVSPDSVAVLLCRATLGELPELKIDTFANATLYAYENYRGDELNSFSNSLEGYKENLSLEKKMKIYKVASEEDPMGLGYSLGLEYVSQIRTKGMTEKDVEAELAAFKKACAADPQTYTRFIKGFKTALREDKGQGIPKDIYQKYLNISEN